MSEPIKSVEEFIDWTKQLDGHMLLYRGLAKACWKVKSSAYHRIELSQEEPLPVTFQNYIKRLLDNAGLQGFRYQHGRKLSDLELLAELQHYGAATCLIDFTENALVALWFACREKPEKDGKVVAMETGDTEKFSTINYEHLNKPISDFLNKEKLRKWTPSNMNNRIVAQQSVFVFGEGIIEESLYAEVKIDAGSKQEILASLEKSFGVKEPHLFNDLAGFALYNAYNKPYGDFTAEDYFLWGVKFHQQEEFEQAIDYYDKAIRLNPRYAKVYNNRGVANSALGNYQDAISDLDEAIRLNPKFAQAYNNRGIAKNKLGDHKGAILDYDKALEPDPRYAEAYNNRGNANSALGNYQDAISDLNEAIRLNPKSAEARNNRGVTKLALADSQGAISDCDKAIELNPQYAGAYYNRGNAKIAFGDFEGAIADYDIALEINPQYIEGYNNRGNAKSDLGDYEGAIANYDKVLEFNPQCAGAYYSRGNAKFALGDLQGAISDYGKAIEINPQHAKAYNNRGNAKEALGDQAGAKKDWDKAREIDPNLQPPG